MNIKGQNHSWGKCFLCYEKNIQSLDFPISEKPFQNPFALKNLLNSYDSLKTEVYGFPFKPMLCLPITLYHFRAEKSIKTPHPK